jgi:Cdc6-like AAA superfamily ATPase
VARVAAARREVQLRELREALATIYTPAQPIDDPQLFSGRTELREELEIDLTTSGAHVVLYGERGVGKTSLWNVILNGRKVARHSASEADDFVSIFLDVLEQLDAAFIAAERKQGAEVTSSFGVEKVASAGTKLSGETVEKTVATHSLDAAFVLDRVAKRTRDLDAIVIDEFQNIGTPEVQTQIIDFVKSLTDRRIAVTVVIVGVADTDDELISSPEYDQYKGRHLFPRRVPRMPEAELRDILELRERAYAVKFDDDVKEAIVQIAGGYPGTAHRLALNAAQAWATRAFVGHAVGAVFALLRVFGVGTSVSIKKAGVHVDQQDLRLAVQRFVRDFREHHPTLTERFDEVRASPEWPDVEKLVAALAASPTARVPSETLARSLGVGADALEALVDGGAAGLVERIDGSCRLTVRRLRTFIEASSYLGA